MNKIVIVSGSVRTGRLTPRAVKLLQNLLENSEKVISAEILDVKSYNFPIMEVPFSGQETPSSKLIEFSQKLKEADAIVLASPEYNSNISGALKNTLDYFYSEFAKKPIGVMTVSTGGFGGINASHILQAQVLGLGGYPMPCKLIVKNVGTNINEEGKPANEQTEQSFNKFIDELLWLTDAITVKKQKELVA